MSAGLKNKVMILFKGNRIIDRGDKLSFKASPGSGENLDLTLVCLGGGQASFDIDIAHPVTTVRLRGVYLCTGDDTLEITVNMHHLSGGSSSDQLFKGIAGGKAKVRFDGRIVVARDAQKTEAYQTNRNLQLSDEATVETLPQLEIYADDVKCSHGATVGRLDEDEQFYMRSRGISLDQARRLQMLSFIFPVIGGLPDDAVEQIVGRLEAMEQ